MTRRELPPPARGDRPRVLIVDGHATSRSDTKLERRAARESLKEGGLVEPGETTALVDALGRHISVAEFQLANLSRTRSEIAAVFDRNRPAAEELADLHRAALVAWSAVWVEIGHGWLIAARLDGQSARVLSIPTVEIGARSEIIAREAIAVLSACVDQIGAARSPTDLARLGGWMRLLFRVWRDRASNVGAAK